MCGMLQCSKHLVLMEQNEFHPISFCFLNTFSSVLCVRVSVCVRVCVCVRNKRELFSKESHAYGLMYNIMTVNAIY